jgi:hypothetical protein
VIPAADILESVSNSSDVPIWLVYGVYVQQARIESKHRGNVFFFTRIGLMAKTCRHTASVPVPPAGNSAFLFRGQVRELPEGERTNSRLL